MDAVIMPQSDSNLRRNGRPQACEPCRIAKHRCDHSTPVCKRCMARSRPDSCVYHPAPLTKTRKLRVTSPARLPRLRPDKRSPQTIEVLTPISSLSPSTYGSSRSTLFKRPGPRYATTSFSAVFRENEAQIGADLLGVEVEELGEQRQVYDDPVRMKLATQTLHDFPTYQTCERLLVSFSTMHDPWLSPKMIKHCLRSLWSTFGHALKGLRTDQGLSYIAYELFKNGENAACPDNDQAWVNWFGGSTLRWEMIGILFSCFGMSMMHLQDWDPIFKLAEQRGHSRKSASRRMKECADACLSLRNTDNPTNDMVVCLFRNNGDEVARSEGLLVTTYIEAGLHRLPERKAIDPQSEFRINLSSSGYYLEKSAALFKARPPALSRFYCSYQIPLDLTEDELYGSPEVLATAVSQLDKDGWNTCGRISTITWSRALCMLTPIREEILEISLGMNMQVLPGRLDQLLKSLSAITSSYPPWLQYCNISQWSQASFSSNNSENFYLVTRIQAVVLQTRFLLERLRQSSSTCERNQDLFNVAQELMAITLSLWLDRDRLYDYQSALHWMAVDFGIPAAGVLCVELLYAVRQPHAIDRAKMSRSDTIQSLVMFVAFLDWVREGDGNYDLCRRLKKVIQNILDYVLGAPVPHRPEMAETHSSGYVGIEAGQFDRTWPDLSGPDWLDLLNNMDWTQGFRLETSK